MEIDKRLIKRLADSVRVLTIDAVEAANAGHPGMPMGAADYAALLWAYQMRFNPQDPSWPGRDRFVLSAGHGSMLLYSLLYLFGYDIALSELKQFRQFGSKAPGHPEFGHTAGVETTTGPLGQGVANGIGMALSSRMLAARYSTDLFAGRVFGIVSDGDLMEGLSSEAASLAGHWGLGNLVYFYDQNQISIGGSTSVCFTEDVAKRFEAFNWHVLTVDGHDYEAINDALQAAVLVTDRPSLICARTVIGTGSPNMSGSSEVHGAPLGEKEAKLAKQQLGWPDDQAFYVPEEVHEFCRMLVDKKQSEYSKWQEKYGDWKSKNPDLEVSYQNQVKRDLSDQAIADLRDHFEKSGKAATRVLCGEAIQIIAKHCAAFIGGSADLEPSTKTLIKDGGDLQKDNLTGRNLRFGVREHAMGAISNGLAYDGSWIPYTATFLVFSDYMRPAIRLAALANLQVLFLFSHDSFFVGEDGPTHQPIEQIASLRLIPNLQIFRPADGLEVAICYQAALKSNSTPSILLFTRQNLAVLERGSGFNYDSAVVNGAYVVSGEECTDFVIVATGSEVGLACEAAQLLRQEGVAVRVVSMPCQELFMKLSEEDRCQIIPSNARKVSIEAGVTLGWERIIGSDGFMIGINHFGASAPAPLLAEKYGFTAADVKEKLLRWLAA